MQTELKSRLGKDDFWLALTVQVARGDQHRQFGLPVTHRGVTGSRIARSFQKGSLMAKKTADPPREPEPEKRRPEVVFKIGFISCSVFVHDVDTENGQRAIRSVNIQKRYKDGNEVKYTTSFGLAELPQVMRVLVLAQQHVEAREAKLELND